ncbi:TetR/AcrR family transcriptional regulator [Sphingomonas lacunae]|uniref:TetR/AcrR family transcriptional regulator n=1 Tax=Sphingomonas lacunae TaxID=2698828 RepID=A0A6M4ASY0_9SPHN|nr:TetR/AcrR family transcriptional regulator [Sphingomonas lacunae]QJQ32183.1 TetR/AcrR family transcriptional regulator [Sphingomonas lacunae]
MAVTEALDIERESKGGRTRRRIMAEVQSMIDEVGIHAISQDAVARRVGITQSALRHHFPTRESMFDAIFDHIFSGFYLSAERVLLEPGHDPRQRLLMLCELHLDYVVSESDRVALQSFAHYVDNAELLARQSGWYHWITDHYAALLGAIRPELDGTTCRGRALAILTMSIGAWITIGRSRPAWPSLPGIAGRDALLRAIEHLIDA